MKNFILFLAGFITGAAWYWIFGKKTATITDEDEDEINWVHIWGDDYYTIDPDKVNIIIDHGKESEEE